MVNTPQKVLLVIPSINGGRLLERMLPTLRFAPSSVVVIDQGSTDSTAEVCAAADVEIVQLGHPHTYTQACNIGAKIARSRGLEYICVSNNDIIFRTDVMSEMLAEMERDPQLGIVAPSQNIIEENHDDQPLSYRVFWNLDRVDFFHDTSPTDGASTRLESDFCELTCALIRLSAIDTIGFLDDEFGFYYEDADFGFRLRQAGYSCAYLPKSQIDHFSGSTFNLEKLARKAEYLAKNKLYFAQKHLGFGVNLAEPDHRSLDDSDVLTGLIHPYLKRYGLIDRSAPELVLSHPDAETSDYLYTAFEDVRIPEPWLDNKDRYQAIMTTSDWMRGVFADSGFNNSFFVPIGVETDIFHPDGPTLRFFDEKTYLAVLDARQGRSIKTVLQAWYRFVADRKRARLILLGPGLLNCLKRAPDSSYRWSNFEIARFEAERIDVYQTLSTPGPQHLAQIYRGVDYTIFSSCGESAFSTILESQACGVPCLFGNYSSTAELAFDNGLTFSCADAAMPGIGEDSLLPRLARHEPSPDDLLRRLEESYVLSSRDREEIGQRGLYQVRSRFTLRHTAMTLRDALAQLQSRDPSATIESLKRRQPLAQAIAFDNTSDDRSATLARRLSGLTARRIKTTGRLTLQLGTLWEEKGFLSASRAIMGELGHFLKSRSEQAARLERGAGKSLRRKGQAALDLYRRRIAPLSGSTLLIGYIDAQLGLGQSLRGLALALSQTRTPFSIYPFGIGVEGRRAGAYMPERYDTNHAHAVNVIEVTPDELTTIFSNISPLHFDRSYNILRTYWELSKAPESWRRKLDKIDEIWAPNDFVAESFSTIFDKPIIVVPPCIMLPEVDADGRSRFGLDGDRWYFLFSFDYYSFPQRKNPLAVVHAFRRAFPDPLCRVGLIVKSTGADGHFPDIKDALRAAARHDRRISIIDQSLSRAQMLSLMGAADCYVSLHRSEGFGLGMAEAMAMGKPVIGTNYSGNTEFLREETGYPIPFRLKRVGSEDYVYAEGQVWADPDEAACAAAMVRIIANRGEASQKAMAGKAFVAERYGPANVGRIVETRLHEIHAVRRPSAAAKT